MTRKLLLPVLAAGLVVSLVCSVFLYRKLVARLQVEASVRLAPTFLVYREENARLAAPRPALPRVVLFGDSRIREWTSLPADGRYEFVNRGIGGETTAQMLGRLESDVISLRPDFVVLQLGVNDLKQFGVLPSAGRLGEQTRKRIGEIASRLHEAGIVTIVSTIFPVGEIPWSRRPFWSSRTEEWIGKINAWLVEGGAGEGIRVWNCDAFFLRDGRMDPRFARDELHLNAAGYRELSGRLVSLLDELPGSGASGSSYEGGEE